MLALRGFNGRDGDKDEGDDFWKKVAGECENLQPLCKEFIIQLDPELQKFVYLFYKQTTEPLEQQSVKACAQRRHAAVAKKQVGIDFY